MPVVRDLIRAVQGFLKHDGAVVAGHLAYLTLLALFPFFIFLVALAGLFGNTETGAQAIVLLLDAVPSDLQLVLEGPVTSILTNNKGGSVLTAGFVGAIWMTSSAIDAARLAIDRAYEGSHPPAFWLRRLQGIGLVLVAGLAILLGMSALVLGPILWNAVLYFLPSLASWSTIADLVRFGASVALFYLALAAVFFALKPRHRGRFVPIARGTLLTLLLWLLTGSGFSFYLGNFAHYDVTYGSLAGAIVALLFFYLVNAALILGAEFNAAAAHRLAARTKAPPAAATVD